MSSIENVVTTTFRARGSQAIATMGQISQGFGQIGRAINETSRLSERLNNQFNAMRTTLRYMVAGSVIYGFANLVTQLKDVQVQMGLISAIGTVNIGGVNNRALTGGNLRDVMDQAREGAVQALTPIKDFNDAVVNLLSSTQNVPKNQIVPITQTIAQAARIAQTDVTTLTQMVTTMNTAFGRPVNLKNIQTLSAEFEYLTEQAPGGKQFGPQIVQQLGPLANVVRASGGRPEDAMWMMLSGLRTGMYPATLGRGLSFMTQTLGFPGQQTKASREAMAQVGITSGSTMPFRERFTRVLQHARSLGVHGNLAKLSDEELSNLEDLPAGQQLGALGATGKGAEYLGTVFRRVHSLRAALALTQQFDTGQAQNDIRAIDNFQRDHAKALRELADSWKKFHQQVPLEEAARNMEAFRLSVAETIAPILNFGARAITRGTTGARGFLTDHREAVQNTIYGGGALAGIIGAGMIAGRLPFLKGPAGRLGGRLLGGAARIPGLRRLAGGLAAGGALARAGQSFVAERALEAGMTGGGAIGSSPQNPLYVIVVGQIFGKPVVADPSVGKGPGGGGGLVGELEKDVGKVAAGAGGAAGAAKAGLFRRAGSLWSKLAGVAEATGATGLTLGSRYGESALKVARFSKFAGLAGMPIDFFSNVPRAGSHAEQRWIQATNAARMAHPGMNITGVDVNSLQKGKLRGTAEIFMTVDVTGPGGKVRHPRIAVPMAIWTDGAVPSAKGKAGQGAKK